MYHMYVHVVNDNTQVTRSCSNSRMKDQWLLRNLKTERSTTTSSSWTSIG